MRFKTVRDVDLKGKRALVRVDFNVPIENGVVLDRYRIEKVLPTINFLKESRAKIILLSHLEDKDKNVLSLEPVFNYLQEIFPDLIFAKDFSELEKISRDLKEGQIVLFENLRFNSGEKENDKQFCEKLSSFGDIYINEAFSVSHREHASIIGLPQNLPHFAGLLFESEIENLSKALSPEHPFLFILAGTKTETKIPLLKKFLEKADSVFIGGVLLNDFLKTKGLEVGDSLISENISEKLEPILSNPKIILAKKLLVKGETSETLEKSINEIQSNDSIKDVIVDGLDELKDVIQNSKFILWNGPLGNLEEGFSVGTKKLAELISASGAKAILGGGNTLSVLDNSTFEKFSFVSTGGGAMIDFLANETLPGLEALEISI